MMEDPAVVASFLDEADERLDAVNRLLLEAEAAGGISSANAGQLQRTLHNLKGAARMVELAYFERLVHILEDIVKLVTTGEFELKVAIPLLLEGVDELSIAGRQMRAANRLVDGSDLEMSIVKLALFLPEEAEPAASVFSHAPAAASPSRRDTQLCFFDPAEVSDMLEDFIAEVAEMFDQMQSACMSLEKQPTPEVVDNLFRYAHTLKGSSGAIGLQAMQMMMHHLEEQLEDVRSGAAVVTPRIIDMLLICLDECAVLLKKVRAGQPFEYDIGPVMARLDAIEKGRVVDSGPAAALRSMPKNSGKEETSSGTALSSVGPASGEVEGAGEQARVEIVRSIRVDIAKLDTVINLVGELAIAKIRFEQHISELEKIREDLAMRIRSLPKLDSSKRPSVNLEMLDGALLEHAETQQRSCDELQRISGDLQKAVMRTRMVPVGQVLTRFQRLVRDFSKAVGKPLKLEILGEETEIDKTVAECISDPLMHIIRNAADHGIETPEQRKAAGKPEIGLIRIEAMYQGDLVVIAIFDDGAGVSRDKVLAKAVTKGLIREEDAAQMDKAKVYELLFRPGFSTAEEVTDISGRGVGLDVVRDNIVKLKGTVMLESTEGAGSKFTIKLPLTLAIIQALIVKIGSQKYALPLATVQETMMVEEAEIHSIGAQESFNLRGEAISLVHLGHILGFFEESWTKRSYRSIVVSTSGIDRVGLEVDAFEGKQEVVIKTLGSILKHVHFTSGTTIMGDGSLVLIVDLAEVVRAAKEWEEAAPRTARENRTDAIVGADSNKSPVTQADITPVDGATILLVDDSPTVLSLLAPAIKKLGARVLTAGDGEEALAILEKERIDAVVTDVTMPNVDGYELCRRIRATRTIENIPVVMISAKGEKLDRDRGFEVEADDYLTKPFDPALLAAKLRGFLKIGHHTPGSG